MGVVKDISARFVDSKELPQLQEWGFQRIPTEMGGLWYHPKRVALKETVTIRFLWPRMLLVSGADPV